MIVGHEKDDMRALGIWNARSRTELETDAKAANDSNIWNLTSKIKLKACRLKIQI